MLLRLRKVIGARDFAELMQQSQALREFEALCSVYGLPRVSSPTTQQSVAVACPNQTTSSSSITTITSDSHNSTTTSRSKDDDDSARISDEDDGMMMDIGTGGTLYMAASAGAQRTWKVLPGDSSGGVDGKSMNMHNWRRRSKRRPCPEIPASSDTSTAEHVAVSSSNNGQHSQEPVCTEPSSSPSPSTSSAQQDILESKQERQKKLRADRNINNNSYLFRPPSAIDPKVILETEISIADGRAVTMRILEGPAYDDDGIDEPENNNGQRVLYEHSGLLRVLSDSEQDERHFDAPTTPSNDYGHHGGTVRVLDTMQLMSPRHIDDDVDDADEDADYATSLGRGLRSPRRVTFGGEIVKMRTPDSDSVATVATAQNSDIELEPADDANLSALAATAQRASATSITATSPRSRRSRAAVRPVSVSAVQLAAAGAGCDGAINAVLPEHKQIEVLHNLQRSPQISPSRADSEAVTTTRWRSSLSTDNTSTTATTTETTRLEKPAQVADGRREKSAVIRSWEELGLVDEVHVRNLLSGVSLGYIS